MAAGLAVDDPQLANDCFTAGLLSVIDAVFQSPMPELLADLPVQTDVRRALLDGSGPVGAVLAAVYAFERADTATLDRLRPDDAQQLRESFGDGAAWGESLRHELAGASVIAPPSGTSGTRRAGAGGTRPRVVIGSGRHLVTRSAVTA